MYLKGTNCEKTTIINDVFVCLPTRKFPEAQSIHGGEWEEAVKAHNTAVKSFCAVSLWYFNQNLSQDLLRDTVSTWKKWYNMHL